MKIGIVGGGAIGGFLAVLLSSAGIEVIVYDIRPSCADPAVVLRDGTRLTPRAPIIQTTEPRLLGEVSVCLVAVKSNATGVVGDVLADVLYPTTPVVTFQNGLRNLPLLRERLGERATGGAITFHVEQRDDVRRISSKGRLFAGGVDDPRINALARACGTSGQRLELRRDIEAVMAGKLLLNLNNGVCAATGMSIREVLACRDARWSFAQCVREGRAILNATNMPAARVTVLPPSAFATVLMLPDALIARVAVWMARVDPDARSSTLVDLDHGRTTEIDALNGEIVRRAGELGVFAPVNECVTEIVHDHEAAIRAGRRPRFIDPAELRRQIASALRPRLPTMVI